MSDHPLSNVTSTIVHIGSPAPGHNNPPKDDTLSPESDAAHEKAMTQLKSIVQRIEAMNEEIKTLTDDRAGIFTEAKGNGFDVKALRTIVRIRAMDKTKRDEQEAILDAYMAALGMI